MNGMQETQRLKSQISTVALEGDLGPVQLMIFLLLGLCTSTSVASGLFLDITSCSRVKRSLNDLGIHYYLDLDSIENYIQKPWVQSSEAWTGRETLRLLGASTLISPMLNITAFSVGQQSLLIRNSTLGLTEVIL